MHSGEIRQLFFDFFKAKQHTIVPSASIVIKNDPTLLFTNAGMNQFKEFFLGNRKPSEARVADSQKCLRVSGKHNDLEEVGVDTYHHTMFEMLGNWSFGNATGDVKPYFKEEAIAWSWELLTKVYRIPEENLYVTIFAGDESEGLPKDVEAFNFWKKWVPEEKIILGSKKDNFWEMGDTGPCGPCTEVHIDCRTEEEKKELSGFELVNKDHPQVIEIWNNVFIQFNRKADGTLEALPAKHVDTGMGFERLVRVIQNKQSNYDTDIFTTIITEIEKIAQTTYHFSDAKQDVAFRVIADHVRAVAFPIADGQLPSNTGAGYVIRRILRRAVRYYFTYLGVKEPLLYKLVPVLSSQFHGVFPEISDQEDFITKVIQEEETAFLRTLDNGLKRVGEIISNADKAGGISGKDAFELYDTYGFPLDLTQLIASEQNLGVDIQGFASEMEQQKNRSRAATAVDTDDWVIIEVGDNSEFTGYSEVESESKILKYRKTKTQGKELFQLVLDKTPFYAESGGQVGDTGVLVSGEEKIPVLTTRKENNEIIHFTQSIPKNPEQKVHAFVDQAKRDATAVHHSATHLLHAALRSVLGIHVQQKGSLVNNDYLRFDFSHFAKLSDEEIRRVEDLVNEKIRANITVTSEELSKDDAFQRGAMALFGEKYGDIVRVITMDPSYSIELCGGTHVANTGELGFFKIISETAVGAGLRRIEALSGKAAENYVQEQLSLLQSIRDKLKNPKDLTKSLEGILGETIHLRKSLEAAEAKELVSLKKDLVGRVEKIGDKNFLGAIVDVPGADSIKKLAFSMKNAVQNLVLVLLSNVDGKAAAVVLIDDNLVAAGLDASSIIKNTVSPGIKGGGGGQKTLATAGGKDTSNFQEIISAIKSSL